MQSQVYSPGNPKKTCQYGEGSIARSLQGNGDVVVLERRGGLERPGRKMMACFGGTVKSQWQSVRICFACDDASDGSCDQRQDPGGIPIRNRHRLMKPGG